MRHTAYLAWGLAIAISNSAFASPGGAEPVRGVWVANVASPTLASPEGIDDFVGLADRCGLNTLYLVVWNRGMTTYPSDIMRKETGKSCDPRYQDFDILRAMIAAAHAKNIRVIAWFEFGFSSSYHQPDGGWLIRNHPSLGCARYRGKAGQQEWISVDERLPT